MAFFTRILNIPRALLARLRDHRKAARYHVGTDFPLMAKISLTGTGSSSAKPGVPAPDACDWHGRVADISSGGLSVRLLPAAASSRNEETSVTISLEGRGLELRCTVAHFRVYSTHALCGLRLNFDDFPIQKAFLQIVEAVSLGASFAPVEGSRKPRTGQVMVRRQWRSLKEARLTEWRANATRKIDHFELVLEGYHIVGGLAEPGLTISLGSGHGKPATPAVEAEVRSLFLWVVANMPASVPMDLKEFMRRAASPAAAPAAAVPPGVAPKAPALSPAEWLPPKRLTRNAG